MFMAFHDFFVRAYVCAKFVLEIVSVRVCYDIGISRQD